MSSSDKHASHKQEAGSTAGPKNIFERKRLRFSPLAERKNRVSLESDLVYPGTPYRSFSREEESIIGRAVFDIRKAREKERPVVFAFGAHTIKNGLAPVLIAFIEAGWVTHLATNGAGIIHDWELSYLGATSEHVKENAARGQFGMWEETGYYINLALAAGAFEGLGYGESVGAFIEREGVEIPHLDELKQRIEKTVTDDPEWCAAALDFYARLLDSDIREGSLQVAHRFKSRSVQAACFRSGIPFTGHPMFGHDIIYTHPLNCGAAIGRTAERDFLRFAGSIADIDGGVYASIGSAVMSPMIFEKSYSMAQNIALQQNKNISNHAIYVVDLMESPWDWSSGEEPPEDNPAYYLRFCKSFSRMGGSMHYLQADNRDFLLTLWDRLSAGEGSR